MSQSDITAPILSYDEINKRADFEGAWKRESFVRVINSIKQLTWFDPRGA